MRPRNLAAFFMAVVFVAPVAGQSPEIKSSLEGNAALKYWQAFGLLPALDKDQEKIVQDWRTVPLDEAARKVIEQSKNSVQYLHRGARLSRCDWAPDYEDGVRLLLPHLAKARTLSRLAALTARQEFEQGNAKSGWGHVVDILRLARHVAVDPIMINQLVGYVIEVEAIDAAAPYLPRIKDALADAHEELGTLLPRATLPQVMVREKESFLQWTVQELKAAERNKPGSWQEVWKGLFRLGDPAERTAAESVKTSDQAVRLVEDLFPVYDELQKLTALPAKDFDARYPDFARKAKSANALAGAVLPAVDKVVAAARRADTRLALLKAAVTVVRDGPDKLKEVKDPFGDGPFKYRALDQGFELKSKLLHKGEPVTLTVGKWKKE